MWHSLRWKLAATYGLLALLTAMLLGGILVLLLSRHFAGLDADRLESAARRAADTVATASPETLAAALSSTAYTMNVRLTAISADGSVIADSGSPWTIPPSQAQGAGGVNRPSDKETRSDLAVDVAARPGTTSGVATIVASEGPSSAGDIMGEVIGSWAVAGALAVVIAAAAGYVISGRISKPLTQLAATSDEMARGDLTARASVSGHDEIALLAKSFNSMADRVEATVESLRRFVSDAAHQIGTPLTALRTDLELVRESALDERSQQRIDRALAQEQRLTDLSSGLLRLSRLETSDREITEGPSQVATCVRSLVDACSSRAEQAEIDIQLTVSVKAADVTIAMPVSRIHDVVGNLLDNALKFTPNGGTIHIDLNCVDNVLITTVSDSGPGIADADRGRVFDRFFRSHMSQQVVGSGLGLSIARTAAENSGGTLTLGTDGPGATFIWRQPLG